MLLNVAPSSGRRVRSFIYLIKLLSINAWASQKGAGSSSGPGVGSCSCSCSPPATFIWIIIYFTARRVWVHPKGVANKLCKRLKPPDILKCCRINQRRDFMFHFAIAESQLDFANWPNWTWPSFHLADCPSARLPALLEVINQVSPSGCNISVIFV